MTGTIGGLFLLGIVAATIFWLAWRKGFFSWSPDQSWNPSLTLKHVLIPFALYFAISFLLGAVYIQILRPSFTSAETFIGLASWLNFLLSLTILFALAIFYLSIDSTVRSNIWHNPQTSTHYLKDIQIAFLAWCIALPFILFATEILETLTRFIFNVAILPDQLAVHFIKLTFAHPLYFFLGLITIIFLAPIIEETLFRGFLQSYIRTRLGPKQAIFITALCFAFFHYSPEQGIGNIPIIGALFCFALFLGFVYEKQGSLFSPIALHAMFNTISLINLYFLSDIPCFF